MNRKKVVRYIASASLISLLSLISINNDSTMQTGWGRMTNVVNSLSYLNLPFILLTILVFLLLQDNNRAKQKNRDVLLSIIASLILSFYLYVGQIIRAEGSLENATSNLLWGKVVIKTIFTALIISLILLRVETVLKQSLKKRRSSGENEKPVTFGKSFVIMLACWLPYYIIIFPGTGNPDTQNQMLEFFGMGKLARSIYPTGHYLLAGHPFTISNQHDFVMTLMVGCCVKAGLVLFGKDNLGFAFASLLQMLFCVFCFSYSVSALSSFQGNRRLTRIIFWMYCLIPIFPIYSLYLVKNTVYSAALILLVVLLMQFSWDHQVIRKARWQAVFCFAVLIQLFSEKYALDVLVVVLLFLLIAYRSYTKKWLLLLLVPMVIVHAGLLGLFRIINVPPSDPIEAYSVPIQQTALCVKKDSGDISPAEYQKLNRVFVVKNLPRLYNPVLADPVKSAGGVVSNEKMGYRFMTVTKSEMDQYKKLWFQMALKHPKTYILAFLNLNYGYLDINSRQANTSVVRSSNSLPLTLVDQTIPTGKGRFARLKQNHVFLPIRQLLARLFNLSVGVPPLSLFLNGVVYLWLTIFLMLICIYASGWKYIIGFVPVIMQVPILLLSPANNSQRYMYPVIFGAFLFLLFVDAVMKKSFGNRIDD